MCDSVHLNIYSYCYLLYRNTLATALQGLRTCEIPSCGIGPSHGTFKNLLPSGSEEHEVLLVGSI